MQHDYYRKYENPKPLRRPTKEEPLLYNLFGSVEDDESMIFTHDDMFEFLFSVAGPNQLPDQIKSEVRGAKNFILLGFKFDKWYVKLVLRLFSLHSGRFLRYAPEGRHALEAPTKEWYEHLFKINFVEENLSQFVQELHRRCGQEGMLKPFGEQAQQVSFAERMRAMIQSGDIDKALDEINAYLEANGPEDLLNDLTLTASSYRRIKRRQSSGTIHSDDAEVKTNQVVSALLDIIEEIKEAEAGSPIG